MKTSFLKLVQSKGEVLLHSSQSTGDSMLFQKSQKMIDSAPLVTSKYTASVFSAGPSDQPVGHTQGLLCACLLSSGSQLWSRMRDNEVRAQTIIGLCHRAAGASLLPAALCSESVGGAVLLVLGESAATRAWNLLVPS